MLSLIYCWVHLCLFNWTKKFNLFLCTKHLDYHFRLPLNLNIKAGFYRKKHSQYDEFYSFDLNCEWNFYVMFSIWRLLGQTKIARIVKENPLMKKRNRQVNIMITFLARQMRIYLSLLLCAIRGKIRLLQSLTQWLCKT